MARQLSFIDHLVIGIDRMRRSATGEAPAPARASPATDHPDAVLAEAARRHAAGLMRINHTGEVCAQALYAAQALGTRNPGLRRHFEAAGQEESDHLAWTRQRMDELGARPSLLNPLWYAGAFGLGLVAGRMGDAVSLGFVVETETQVGAHLDSHLQQLPASDHASRAIVAQMRDDEIGHARQASIAGAAQLPRFVGGMMRAAAKVMTTVAQRV